MAVCIDHILCGKTSVRVVLLHLVDWSVQDLVAYAKEVDVRLHSHNDDRGVY